MNVSKKHIRQLYREKRLALSVDDIKQLSIQIGDVLQQSGCLNTLRNGHFFMPIDKNKEPNCLLIQQQLTPDFQWHTGIVKGTTMQHVAVDKHTQYVLNEWQIPEPIATTFVHPAHFDFVLIPLLAVDNKGNRVGYGKGYYDQFLKECNPNCKLIGVSFFEPISETLITDQWDIPLHHCVTPKRMHTFTVQ